jgi:hypothetical protein
MKKIGLLLLLTGSFYFTQAQLFPKTELEYLTSNWKGERFEDGRPKISDALIARAKKLASKKLGKYFITKDTIISLKEIGKWYMMMFL